eukprot:TRINITY_DN1341_c0_g1_i1.p2 TRINITY_DN1341_c0_g1~~TRINITY_DN1341_c0_g1_i1.p2  ORF type:complete len:173 (-),score=34.78 TRINITY_DN1341_c0_g1_i1:27-545(-)
MADLAITSSIDTTTDNILEGRLTFADTTVESPISINEWDQPSSTSSTSNQNFSSIKTTGRVGVSTSDMNMMEAVPEVPKDLKQFAETPLERHSILQRRKEALLLQARNRYREKSETQKEEIEGSNVKSGRTEISEESSKDISTEAEDSVETRRQRVLEATRLRIRQTHAFDQ